jgi:nucleoside-triphosphatase THEP1
MSRVEIEQKIEDLYNSDYSRKYIIDKYFSESLDNRSLNIKKDELPTIQIFKTYLIEPTVNVAVKILDIQNILLIEGKPGVGKSHLVNNLEKKFKNNLVYRFWVSNQDSNYHERLQYSNFIFDLSKKIYQNLKQYTEDQIIDSLASEGKTVIIDGLDHVENYNHKDLKLYIDFIDKLKVSCKVIVLSRPLRHKLSWEKQLLGNWNHEQTKQVLNELYHIDDYTITLKIFEITNGYPILVRYIAEQYRKDGTIPDYSAFDTIEEYYTELLKNQTGKNALSLFVCVRSYITFSEIDLFLDPTLKSFVSEFIEEHPYLFEIRLNRITLFHDSFITYLRKQNINHNTLSLKVKQVVVESIMFGKKQFLSRFDYFDLTSGDRKDIVIKYCSIEQFKTLMEGVIDFEAIKDFYEQIREALSTLSSDTLTILQYYDLSLIINIVARDHISSLNGFHYTYCKALLANGYTIDDITSNRYLFGMFYYLKTNDGSLILNATSNDHYDTSRFYTSLQNDAVEEIEFFKKHTIPLTIKRIKELLAKRTQWKYRKVITYILEDIYLHKGARKAFPKFYNAINLYMDGFHIKADLIFADVVMDYGIEAYQASWILRDAKDNLLSYGTNPATNDYIQLSLKDYILKNRDRGSFYMWVEILNYLRLALHQNRQFDVESISLFWTKYYQRKDYSLYSLNTVLPVFEKLGFVKMIDSVILINKIQEVSEKGYNGLLADYIMQHPPSVINKILKEFHPTDLSISWFLLKPKYINVLPDRIYNLEIRNQFRFDRSNKQIRYDDVENLLKSKKVLQFKDDLNFHCYAISIAEKNPAITTLKKLKIPYISYKDDENKRFRQTVTQRYEDGVLDVKNKRIINERKLKPSEVASFTDGNYCSLSNLELFSVFSREEIAESMQAILYNAITSKLRTIDHFHILFYFPGNVIKIMHDNNVVEDFKDYFESFNTFLELSMFELNRKTEITQVL